jgi:hypothetical protein
MTIRGPEDDLYNPSCPRRPNATLRPFANLSNNLYNQLYAHALKIWQGDTIGTGYLTCGLKAAKEAFVSVSTTDRPGFKLQSYKRPKAIEKLQEAASTAASISPDHSVYPSVEMRNMNGVEINLSSVQRPRGACRNGKSGRKQKVPVELAEYQDQQLH